MFLAVSRVFRGIMGCSGGVPGLFRAVPGCSGVVPGMFRGVPGVFRGVPGCSGVFRVLQTPSRLGIFFPINLSKIRLYSYKNKPYILSNSCNTLAYNHYLLRGSNLADTVFT